MWAENVQGKPSRYAGCGKDLADGQEEILQFTEKLHRESVEIFSRLTDQDLNRKCTTPDGASFAVWKWLRAMVEHEVHHRGQISHLSCHARCAHSSALRPDLRTSAGAQHQGMTIPAFNQIGRLNCECERVWTAAKIVDSSRLAKSLLRRAFALVEIQLSLRGARGAALFLCSRILL